MVLGQAAQMKLEESLKKIELKVQMQSLRWFEQNYAKVFKDPFRPSHLVPKKAETLYNRIMEVRREEFQREQNAKKEDELREEETRKKLLALVESRDVRYGEEKDYMYPVSEELKDILYTGVSMTGEGRYLYLKIRNKMAPEDKFRRIITETQVYGWKIEERSERPLKEHNRLSIIQDSFYRRFGAIKPESMRKNPPFSKAQISMDVL